MSEGVRPAGRITAIAGLAGVAGKARAAAARRRIGGTALVGVIGLWGTGTVAGAAQAGEPFTVSPGQGMPFTVVEVSGEGCVEGPSPSIAGELVGPPEAGTIVQFTTTPDEEGDWAGAFTVPPNKPVGRYRVTATCKTDRHQPSGAAYQDQPFTVLAGEAATLTVSPRIAQAGQDVRVRVAGTLCRGEPPSVDVMIFVRAPEELGDADEFVARMAVDPDDGGEWTAELTIPASSPPATYRVGAQCFVGGFQFLLYTPIDVVLTAAPAPSAVAVTSHPVFAG